MKLHTKIIEMYGNTQCKYKIMVIVLVLYRYSSVYSVGH